MKGLMLLLNKRLKVTTSDYIMETNKIKSQAKINSAVIIPALNPISSLVDFVGELLERGVPQVIVVNDGSDSSFNNVFIKLNKFKKCTVLRHEANRGKGRALKTAFSYFTEYYSDLDGAVTADADGQHTVEDICIICERLSLRQDSLILGVRNFKENNVPKRSYIGNTVTSNIFKLLYGSKLNDTQTGLRGIPTSELTWMVNLKGERYDYEINMLINAKRCKLNFEPIPIKTVYFNNNSGSHYSTIKDSIPIFLSLISGLVQYSGAIIASGFLDIITFFILNSFVLAYLPAVSRIFACTVIARLISSICNYILNRKFIFSDRGKLASSAVRYYILCICLMMASYFLVYTISLSWKINESVIKLLIDTILGFVSYQIQLRWVFQNRDRVEASLCKGL